MKERKSFPRERERKGKRKLLCNLSFEKKCKRYSYWVSYPTDILGYRIYCCVYLYARIERWETILCRPFQIQRKRVLWPMGHFLFLFSLFFFLNNWLLVRAFIFSIFQKLRQYGWLTHNFFGDNTLVDSLLFFGDLNIGSRGLF